MADVGWEGKWEPNIVGEGTKNELRDRAGEPVMMKNGRPNEWCLVNLRTGEFRYPARN
jgi:hypothetical protein